MTLASESGLAYSLRTLKFILAGSGFLSSTEEKSAFPSPTKRFLAPSFEIYSVGFHVRLGPDKLHQVGAIRGCCRFTEVDLHFHILPEVLPQLIGVDHDPTQQTQQEQDQ